MKMISIWPEKGTIYSKTATTVTAEYALHINTQMQLKKQHIFVL